MFIQNESLLEHLKDPIQDYVKLPAKASISCGNTQPDGQVYFQERDACQIPCESPVL